MTQDNREHTLPSAPPIPVGLEDLMGMAAASRDFAAELISRRGEAVTASGVELAPTEAAVLGAVDDTTLARMIENCRARQASAARRAFLARASAALLLLVGAGAAAGCEKKTTGGARQPGATPGPEAGPPRNPPAMRVVEKIPPDAGAPRERPVLQVSAGERTPRPRPMRPSGVKTGISPEHRRPQKLDVETGSRPD